MSCPGDNYVVPGANPCSGGGGSPIPGAVNSVTAGINTYMSGTPTDPIVNSTGVVQSITTYGGSGITIGGTAQNPTIGTIGVVRSVFGNGTTIGVGGTPSDPVVNLIGTYVNSITAGSNITITGPSNAPTIASVDVGVLTVNPGTNITITGPANSPTISASGTLGVATVSPGTNITISGTPTNPVINANTVYPPVGGYSKSTRQVIGSGSTLITWNYTRSWNDSGYFTQTNPTTFTCLVRGVYQLNFSLSITQLSGVWTDTLKTATIIQTSPTASPPVAPYVTQSIVQNGLSYRILVNAVAEIYPNDTLQFYSAGNLVSGSLFVECDNVIDFNTTFTWTLLKPTFY